MAQREIIYGLTDQRGRIRYVGRTYQPQHRLRGHWYQRHAQTRLGAWLREIGRTFGMVVLEDLNGFDKRGTWGSCDSREKHWIEKLVAEGHDLLNVVHHPLVAHPNRT